MQIYPARWDHKPNRFGYQYQVIFRCPLAAVAKTRAPNERIIYAPVWGTRSGGVQAEGEDQDGYTGLYSVDLYLEWTKPEVHP